MRRVLIARFRQHRDGHPVIDLDGLPVPNESVTPAELAAITATLGRIAADHAQAWADPANCSPRYREYPVQVTP